MPKDCFDKWESATKTIRNICLISGTIVIIVLLIMLFPKLKEQIKSVKVQSISASPGGIQISFFHDLNIPERIKGADDSKVIDPVIKNAAQIINTEEISWVYLGVTTPKGSQTNWLYNFFDIKSVPKSNDVIQASTDIFKRSDQPRVINGNWSKGYINGLIKQGQKVRVIAVAEIPGAQKSTLWWAKVQLP